MSSKNRIEELERRVRELEGRPPVVIIQPAAPLTPWPYYPLWQPREPGPLPLIGWPGVTY